jgi:hypothetical protein
MVRDASGSCSETLSETFQEMFSLTSNCYPVVVRHPLLHYYAYCYLSPVLRPYYLKTPQIDCWALYAEKA